MPDDDTPPPRSDVDTEGDGDDHAVPPELSEIHEAVEWIQAVDLGPNEAQ